MNMGDVFEKEVRSLIPPAPFRKGVAKESDLVENNSLGDRLFQRGIKRLNSDLMYVPYNLNLKGYARKLRRGMTRSEQKLWRELLSRDKTGFRFLRQKPLGNYIADFYCSALMLIIEVDGASHFTDEGKKYDLNRTAILATFGIKVIRYTNKEVMENIEGVNLDLMGKIKLRRNELSLD